MKRTILLLCVFLGLLGVIGAQAYEDDIQYDKKKQQAIAIKYDYPAEAVENAIIRRMEQLGYKVKEEKGILNRDKGFLVFRNAYVTDISDKRMDYIVKVERKSRKESDESVLYMIMSKDGENAMTTLEAYDVGRAKSFLNNMLPEIEDANLELQIKAQVETVSKAEKKLKDLRDDQAALEKKLTDNGKAQVETQKDIEAQKASLETLLQKRRN